MQRYLSKGVCFGSNASKLRSLRNRHLVKLRVFSLLQDVTNKLTPPPLKRKHLLKFTNSRLVQHTAMTRSVSSVIDLQPDISSSVREVQLRTRSERSGLLHNVSERRER